MNTVMSTRKEVRDGGMLVVVCGREGGGRKAKRGLRGGWERLKLVEVDVGVEKPLFWGGEESV